jgi:hypothetical protein
MEAMLGQDSPVARSAAIVGTCRARTRSNRMRVFPSPRSRANCVAQFLISFLAIPRNLEVNILSSQKKIEAIRNKPKRFKMFRFASEGFYHTCASLPDALG